MIRLVISCPNFGREHVLERPHTRCELETDRLNASQLYQLLGILQDCDLCGEPTLVHMSGGQETT